MKHASRRPLAWLIFDVGPYPLLFAMRRFEMRFLRAHAVGRAELKGFHAVDTRGCANTRSGWWVFESSVQVGQSKLSGSSTIFVVVGTVLESAPSYDVREACVRAIPPNKAPEPTTFAVTSRATERLFEMKQQNPSCDAARAVPAKVVADLER